MKIHFDGCCEPFNPGGNMGFAAVLTDNDGKVIDKLTDFVPADSANSNNVSEYMAFLLALDLVVMHDLKTITIFGDSQLVVKQMRNEWRVKAGAYVKYAHKAIMKLSALNNERKITVHWIPREANEVADDYSKSHLKERNIPIKLGK